MATIIDGKALAVKCKNQVKTAVADMEQKPGLAVGFLNVFHRHVLLAVDVDRQQIHVAPEDVADVVQLLVEDDVAAFEQRIHRIAHDVDRAVAFGEVGDVDEIDGPRLRVIGEERHQARRPFYGVEGDALQRQRVVRAVHVGGQIGFGIEHFPFSAIEPVRIDIQFLNQDVLVPGRERRLARFDHRKGGLSDA